MFYDSRWFHAHDTKRPSLRPAFGPSLCPLRASRLGHPDLPCAAAPIHRLLVHLHLKSSHPEGSVREKIAGTGSDTYGSLWRRTDSGREKGRGRSDGLGEGETFLENSPSQCLQTLSALIRFVSCTATPGRLPPSRIPTHTDCSYNQYKTSQ